MALEAGSRRKPGGGLATPPLAVARPDGLATPLAAKLAEAGALRNALAYHKARMVTEEA